jgi:RNA polymerase sigma factor (sigma-70 family)
MTRPEADGQPSVEQRMIEAVRTAPAGSDAEAWILWAHFTPEVLAQLRQRRPPSTVDPEDFRQAVYGRVERRFLRHARSCETPEALRRLLRWMVKHSVIDQVRREAARSSRIVPVPETPEIDGEGGCPNEFFGATHEPETPFDDGRVDPSAHAQIEQRARLIREALERMPEREPGRRAFWSRAAKSVRMRYLDGLSRAEVAAALGGMSERQTDRYITAGLNALEEMLGGSLGPGAEVAP